MTLATWIPLLLIPPAVGLLVRLIRSKDWFAARRRRVLAASILAASLVLVALCGPAVDIPWGEAPTVIFVADASPSMRFGQPWQQAAHWVRRELPGSSRFGIVSFADASQVAAAPGRPLPATIELGPSAATGPGTNIEQALRSAMALATEPERTALLLYSDGYETEGRARLAAAEAGERGFRLFCLPPAKPPVPPNAALVDLRCPEQLDVGRAGKVRVALRSNHAGTVNVLLHHTSEQARPAPDTVAVELREGVTQWAEFSVEFADAGWYALEVELKADGWQDAVPEDDRWPLGIQAGDRKPVLLVHYRPEHGGDEPPAVPWPPDVPVRALEASQMPIDAADLAGYSAVVLHDVPAFALSSQALAAMTDYVRDVGGGLMALGGRNSFGLGGYARTPLDDTLPVKSDPEDRPPVRVIIVLDHSASMNRPVGVHRKLDLAREAVLRISTLLGAKDRVGLVVFNHVHEILADDVDSAHWETLRSALGRVQATGGTKIGPALETALDMLRATPATTADGKEVRRHVIALSDGIVIGDDRETPFDVAALAARAAELKTTVSVVLTGEAQAWPGLRQLAEQAGGRFYDISSGLVTATGRNRLARILLEDLDLPLLEEKPAAVALGVRPPLWAAGATPGPFADVPQHVVTEAKQRAQVHLVGGEKRRPLLATWQYGLGRAAAWPLPWQGENLHWLGAPGPAQAWLASLQWVSRGPVAEADYDVHVTAVGGRLEASVQQRDLPPGLAAMPTMKLSLSGRSNQKRLDVDLDQTDPGRWALSRSLPAGVYGYALRSAGDSGEQLIRRGTLSTGPSLEFRGLDNNDRALAGLATVGGGRLLASPSDAAALVMPAARRTELWPYAVGLAGLVLLAEALWDLLARGR